jgi:hypothetical protein
MIKKNMHQIWYENSMKLNNEWWNCQKQVINKRTQNKKICNHKNKDQIQQKKKKLKSNDWGLKWKIKSN